MKVKVIGLRKDYIDILVELSSQQKATDPQTLASCILNLFKARETENKNKTRVDGLAQWLERWTGGPKVEGSNAVRSFSESKRLC